MGSVEAARWMIRAFFIGSLGALLASPSSVAWAEGQSSAVEGPLEGGAGAVGADLFERYPELGPVMAYGFNFMTLQEAIDAVGTDPQIPGNMVTLIGDVEESVTVPTGKDVTINLLARHLTGEHDKPTITIESGGKLTLVDDAETKGTLNGSSADCPTLLIKQGGVAELRSGTIGSSGTGPAVDNRGSFIIFPGARVEGEVLGGVVRRDHEIVEVPEVPAGCCADGRAAHWRCEECGLLFSDAEGSSAVTEDGLMLPRLGHSLMRVPGRPATERAEGVVEHWECGRCGALFADPNWEREVARAETIVPKLETQEQGQMQHQQVAAVSGACLPQTGDDSTVPVVIAGVVGVGAVVAGVLLRRRRGR